jgi:hypothetical protein
LNHLIANELVARWQLAHPGSNPKCHMHSHSNGVGLGKISRSKRNIESLDSQVLPSSCRQTMCVKFCFQIKTKINENVALSAGC